jgi:hypothetical protein
MQRMQHLSFFYYYAHKEVNSLHVDSHGDIPSGLIANFSYTYVSILPYIWRQKSIFCQKMRSQRKELIQAYTIFKSKFIHAAKYAIFFSFILPYQKINEQDHYYQSSLTLCKTPNVVEQALARCAV